MSAPGESNPWRGFVVVVLAVVALPLVVAWFSAPRLTGRVATWRWRARRPRAWVLTLIGSVALTVAVGWLLTRAAGAGEWRWVLVLWLVLWVAESPWAALVVSLRLRNFATQLEHGRVPPNRAEPARAAIRQAAIAEADARLRRLNGQLPRRTKSGTAVIGIDAEPPDHRHFIERWVAPQQHRLSGFTEDGLAVLPFDPNSPAHHLVVGATGSGKTTLLAQMTKAALDSGFRVAVLDFKGAEDEAARYLRAAAHAERPIVWRRWPGQALDLWRGTPQDIADRVMGFIPPPAAGGSEFYRARIVRAINAVLVRTSAGVPRSPAELTERVRKAGSYAQDPEDRAVLLAKEQGREVCVAVAEALGAYLEPLRREGAQATSGGFSWEDGWDLAVLSFNATSEQEIRLGAAVLSDFDAWSRSSRREIDARPLLLIIDEGGALGRINGAPALTNLVARARSARVGVVVASQTITSLGPDGEELLHTGPIRWAGRSPAPEALANASGTRRVVETGHQDGNGGLTGARALREQSAFVLDPDTVRGLPVFHWWVSDGRAAARVMVPRQ